jgi:hypothetical protein
VDSLSLLTSHNLHQVITNPATAITSPTRHSPSQLTEKPLPEREDDSKIDHVPDSAYQPTHLAVQRSSQGSASNNITRQFSSDYTPHLPVVYTASPVADLLKGTNLFKLLRRKKKKKDSPGETESSLPPQTPPKDDGHPIHPMLATRSDIRPSRTEKILQHQRSRSMSDLVIRSSVDTIPANDDSHLQYSAQLRPLPLRGKWANKGAILADPVERACLRRELQLQKEREEQELVKEEAERQRRLKLEKEKILRKEKEEEARRLAEVEEEISRIRLERRRREQLEKEEEEEQRRGLEDRKHRDRKRRLEEHQRLEEWRKQQAQKLGAATQQAAEIQRREEAKRRDKIQLAEALVKQTKGERELTGWTTMQNRDEISWRRRHFKFVENTMLLYRSAEVSDFD